MPRGPNRIRKSEVTRILDAGRTAGAKSARVILKDGEIFANFDFSDHTVSPNSDDVGLPPETPDDLRKLI